MVKLQSRISPKSLRLSSINSVKSRVSNSCRGLSKSTVNLVSNYLVLVMWVSRLSKPHRRLVLTWQKNFLRTSTRSSLTSSSGRSCAKLTRWSRLTRRSSLGIWRMSIQRRLLRCSTRWRTIYERSKDSFCYAFLPYWQKSMLPNRLLRRRFEANLHPHQDKQSRKQRHLYLAKNVNSRSCLKFTLFGSRPSSQDKATARVSPTSKSRY